MHVNQLDVVAHEERLDRVFRLVWWIFLGSIGFSLGGTLLIRLVPSVLGFFGPYYTTLVKVPTWTYMALLPVLAVLMYARAHGWALVGFFAVWGCLIGGMSELIGTSTGVPFGPYAYTNWLGPRILDHVPYFIPLSWFAMSIVSLDLARRIVARRYERILTASVFMVLWDVSLDPAMNRAFPMWAYRADGFFYGMPASNWAGWFVVTLVIVWGYEVIGGGLRATSRWAPRVYLANCLFPLGLSLLYGLYGAVLIGALATAVPLLAVRGRSEPGDDLSAFRT